MGTFFTNGADRNDIIKEVLSQEKFISHHLRGNILWGVVEYEKDGQTYRYIPCFILVPDKDGWGYKPMDETMGPLYYTCPLKYFDMVPLDKTEYSESAKEYAKEWRQKVIDENNFDVYREIISEFKRIRKEGTNELILVTLKEGYKPEGEFTMDNLRPFVGINHGKPYKLKKKAIDSYRIVKDESLAP